MYYKHFSNTNKEILSSHAIPISLWKQDESHLFHKNVQILTDRNGRKMCIKCLRETFMNNMKLPTYLSQICEDLIILIKCERSKGVIKYIISELLRDDGIFIINELNKTSDEILINNLINLCITLLNKHFSIAENNQRITLCQNLTSIIVNKINESNVKLKPIVKLLFLMFDDKLSVYSNVMLEDFVENSEKLKNFGNILYKLDRETMKYLLPLFVRIIEYKPEKTVKELISDKGLILSVIFCQYSEEIRLFKYVLEFYMYILLSNSIHFTYLIAENDKVRQNKLLLNILNGINKATFSFSKSSKYLKHRDETNNVCNYENDLCGNKCDSMTIISDMNVSSVVNNYNLSDYTNLRSENGNSNSNYLSFDLSSTEREKTLGLMLNRSETKECDINYNVLVIKPDEDSEYKLVKNLVMFLKDFLLYKSGNLLVNKLEYSKYSCNNLNWMLEHEKFEVIQKIIEWIIELLKNSIDIEFDNLALDCLLQIFTSSQCKVQNDYQSSSNNNSKSEETFVDVSDCNFSPGRNININCNEGGITKDNCTKFEEQSIFNVKSMNSRSKRVTFKRVKSDNSVSMLECGESEVGNINGKKSEKISDEFCFHRIFTIKHGQYLMDILLELLDDYLHKHTFIWNKSNGLLYVEKYGYLLNNKSKIEEIILKIIKVMYNISESIAMQSCPRQIYALCWFMEYIMISGCENSNSSPPIPLFGSSNMDMIMQTINNTNEPLEKVLVCIAKNNLGSEYNRVRRQNSTMSNCGTIDKEASYDKNSANIHILVCNNIISLINELCVNLKMKLENMFNSQNYTNSTSLKVKELWKLNGTIYNRELLLEYFSYIIISIQKLNEVGEINVAKLMESTNILFELYSSELNVREYGLLSLCQLKLIEDIINLDSVDMPDDYDEDDVYESNDNESINFSVRKVDNLKQKLLNNNKNDIFSLILVIDKRIQDKLENEKDKNTYDIFTESKRKVELLIYNKMGASIVFKWLKNKSSCQRSYIINAGNTMVIDIKKRTGTEMTGVSSHIESNNILLAKDNYDLSDNKYLESLNKTTRTNLFGIDNNVINKWIVYIAKQLLHPILDEKEITNRVKHLSKNKIRSSLFLDESVSNDTICITISLLFFCYKYYPRSVYLFILGNIHDSEFDKDSYKKNEESEGFNGNIGTSNRASRNIPTRIILYYSYILLSEIKGFNNIDSNTSCVLNNSSFKTIVENMLFNLVNTRIRKREWLFWHTKKFGKMDIFSKSLELLLREKSNVGDYNMQKNIEELLYKWIYERIVEYSKYQISTESTYTNFSISPILEKSLINNISLIKYEIKQLLRLSSVKLPNKGLHNSNEYDEYIYKFYIHLNIYIYSLHSLIKANSINIVSQITMEEVVLPIKLLLNNKDEYDNNLKHILTEVYLNFINIFMVNIQIKTMTVNENEEDSVNNLFYTLITLIIDVTSWINSLYIESNMAKLDIEKYFNIVTNAILEYMMNYSSKYTLYKIKQSFLNYIQSESTILLFEKVTSYLMDCIRLNNNIVIENTSYLLVLSLITISLLLKNIGFTGENEITKIIYTFITHPTILIHGGGIGNKCYLGNTNKASNVDCCEYCINYGLSHKDTRIKLLTIVSFIMLIINNGEASCYNNIIPSNSKVNQKIIKDVYMHSIIKIFELIGLSGNINKNNSNNSSQYLNRLMSQGYMSIIIVILYFSSNKTLALSLVNNLYLQKYLTSCLISDIKSDNISDLSVNASNDDENSNEKQKFDSLRLYYLTLCSYLIYIVHSSPWWFNISKELLTIPVIKAFGKLYRASKMSYYNNIQDDTWKYLYIVSEILLKSMMRINMNTSSFEDEGKIAQGDKFDGVSSFTQIKNNGDHVLACEYNTNNSNNITCVSSFNIFYNLIHDILSDNKEISNNLSSSFESHGHKSNGHSFENVSMEDNNNELCKANNSNGHNIFEIIDYKSSQYSNRDDNNYKTTGANYLIMRVLQFLLNLMYKRIIE